MKTGNSYQFGKYGRHYAFQGKEVEETVASELVSWEMPLGSKVHFPAVLPLSLLVFFEYFFCCLFFKKGFLFVCV